MTVSTTTIKKIERNGRGEIDQYLRALTAFSENWVWFPAPTWQLRSIFNSRSKGSDCLLCPPWSPYAHGAHRYWQANTRRHINTYF